MVAETAQSWLLTYALHSTILLGGVWLLCLCFRSLPVALQEALWRTALLGGLLTATLHVAFGFEAFGARMEIAASAPPPAAEAPLADTALPEEEFVRPLEPAPVDAAASTVLPTPPARPNRLAALIAALWTLGALFALFRFARTRRTLHARLARRTPVASGPLRAALDRLSARTGVRGRIRLSRAGGLGSPVALGFGRREICIPDRAASELSPAHQEVMLAHELAHHLRRDPLWLAAGRWIEALFFFQPLNVLAGRRLRETAELLCDAWAAEATGRRRALAECLTVVAEWVLDQRSALPLPAMAQRGAALNRRVRTLLEDEGGDRAVRRSARYGVVALPLLAVTLLAPAVGRTAATEAVRPSMEAHRPLSGLAASAAALDEEMAALRAEMDALTALLTRADSHEPLLARGAGVLKRRIAALDADRTALQNRIRLHLEATR